MSDTLHHRFLTYLQANGPCAIAPAAMALTEDPRKVRKAAWNLGTQGCVTKAGKSRGAVYTFVKFPNPTGSQLGSRYTIRRWARRTTRRTVSSSGVVAGRIIVGRGFRWLESSA